jgi:elongation factor P--(R)-beta-lysine ligase
VAEKHSFLPTAPIKNIIFRATLLEAVRSFFRDRAYLEVDTPILSADATVDPNISPFATRCLPGNSELYLQTSPEFAMKRLLAAGHTAIFQVTHAFRNGEIGRLHNPEFTIVEWYRLHDTYHQQMDVVEELVRHVFMAIKTREGVPRESVRLSTSNVSFRRLSYKEAFERHAGFDPLTIGTEEIPKIAASKGITAPPGLAANDRDGWLNFLLVEMIEPNLGQNVPEFVYDYPSSQAALARIRHDDPPVAERFELYVKGIEICNGYQELTDAEELGDRIRKSFFSSTSTMERLLKSRLIYAMEAGLPECSGVALGFDRLVMLAVQAESLADVILFPFSRA